MKVIGKSVLTAGYALCALLAGGCTSFEYVGRSFGELPENVNVAYYTKASQMPAGKYKLMGRGLLIASRKFDRFDIEEALISEARKRGASAVLKVSETKHLAAWCEDDDPVFASPSDQRANPYNLSPDGTPLETDAFGTQQSSVSGTNRRKMYGKWETHVRAQFYCPAEQMADFLRRRREYIDATVNAPADDLRLPAKEKAPEKSSGAEKTVTDAASLPLQKAEKADAPQQ